MFLLKRKRVSHFLISSTKLSFSPFSNFSSRFQIVANGGLTRNSHDFGRQNPMTFVAQHRSLSSSVPGDSRQNPQLKALPEKDEKRTEKEGHMTRDIITMAIKILWPKSTSSNSYLAQKSRIVVAFSLLIASKILHIQVPVLFKSVIDSLTPISSVLGLRSPISETRAETAVISGVSSEMLESLVVGIPVGLIVGYGAARAGAALFNEIRNAIFAEVAQKSIHQLAIKSFRHLHQLSLDFHLSRETGAVARILDRGSRGITWLLNSFVFHIAPTILEIGLVLSLLGASFGAPYVAITSATLISYTGYTLLVTSWRTKLRKEMNRLENDANARIVDSLLNFETVKYFGNEEYEVGRYQQQLQQYEKSAVSVQSSLALLNFGQSFIFTAAITSILWMSAGDLLLGQMSIGDLVMINALLFQLSVPLNFLGTVYRELRQALTDMEQMFVLMTQKSLISDTASAKPLSLDNAVGPSIIFDQVDFRYDQERPIFEKMSFAVSPGQKVAFVGSSGSGKSTISRLLFRFYDPQSGSIKINDMDLKDLTLESLRKSIGIVPQDTVLFNDTLFNNIHYGDPTASHEQVVEAARAAQLEELVSKLPNGWDSKVGERGLKLSGGEKQRVAIARVLLKRPQILLFDEATSALDSKTEMSVMQALNSIAHNRTTVVIAHRLSTIVDADRIYVLGDHRILEEGTHEQLLLNQGPYKDLWSMQSKEQTSASIST